MMNRLPIQTLAVIKTVLLIEQLNVHDIMLGDFQYQSTEDADNAATAIVEQLNQVGDNIKAVQTVYAPCGKIEYRRYYAAVKQPDGVITTKIFIAELALDGNILAPTDVLHQHVAECTYVILKSSNAAPDHIGRAKCHVAYMNSYRWSDAAKLYKTMSAEVVREELNYVKDIRAQLDARMTNVFDFERQVLTLVP